MCKISLSNFTIIISSKPREDNRNKPKLLEKSPSNKMKEVTNKGKTIIQNADIIVEIIFLMLTISYKLMSDYQDKEFLIQIRTQIISMIFQTSFNKPLQNLQLKLNKNCRQLFKRNQYLPQPGHVTIKYCNIFKDCSPIFKLTKCFREILENQFRLVIN